MEPNQVERDDLADRLRDIRYDRFRGKRNLAYAAAEVNSGTWTKAEKGRPISEGSLVAIVKMAWPETKGDWTRIEPPLGGDAAELLSPEVLAEVEGLSPDVRAHIIRLLIRDAQRRRDERASA